MSQLPLSKLVFQKHDADKSGHICINEFHALAYEMGYYFSQDELVLAIKILDTDGDGKISYDEFAQWWKTSDRFKHLQLDEEKLNKLKMALTYFEYFDRDHSGTIDAEEFRHLHGDMLRVGLTRLGYEQCLKELDRSGNGQVGFNEFVAFISRGV